MEMPATSARRRHLHPVPLHLPCLRSIGRSAATAVRRCHAPHGRDIHDENRKEEADHERQRMTRLNDGD